MLGHLDSRELADFIRLLEMARNQCDERRTPGCDGNENAGIPAAADTCARLE
jgi:hypothetical protein